MVTYAQTNATTIDVSKLNNAFEEEVSNAQLAWDKKYRHLWRVSFHVHSLGTSSNAKQTQRKFYAPDDMMLVAFTVDGKQNTQAVVATLTGDTEVIGGDAVSVSGTFTGSYAPLTRTSYDARTDPKFFIRRGGLYTIKITASSSSGGRAFVSAVFAAMKRST